MTDLENTTDKVSADARHARRGTLIAAVMNSTVHVTCTLAVILVPLVIIHQQSCC